MNILLTGGTGYIGSHVATVLARSSHNIVLFDNLCNSSKDVVLRLEQIINKSFVFIEGDVRNTELLVKVMRIHQIDAVIHLAGLKVVSESVANPVLYFANNVHGTISLLQAMQQLNVKTFIFSSSAAVYGEPVYLPYDEAHPTNPINPYGNSKLQVEVILRDLVNSDPTWRVACLRYFNPVGAHESGMIGDHPNEVPANLAPYLARVASRNLNYINIFGNDYPTCDGTGERDYIHVMDLAEGHMAALDFLYKKLGLHIVNLGTGNSTSVLELLRSFERASGMPIPFKIATRREGDPPISYADVKLAREKFGWNAKRTLDDMSTSAWFFEKLNSKKLPYSE